MAMHTLDDLLLHEIKDLYDAEHQLTEALPKMAKAAKSTELQKAFNDHLKQTQGHIKRLEQAFASLGAKPQRKACKGMQGLIKEGDEVLQEDMDDDVKDAALIAAAQRVEHYEMAGYGTVRTFAYALGHHDVATVMQQTLDEEEQTDKMLTQIANKINVKSVTEA